MKIIAERTQPRASQLFVRWISQIQVETSNSRNETSIEERTQPGGSQLFVRWISQIQVETLSSRDEKIIEERTQPGGSRYFRPLDFADSGRNFKLQK